MQNKFITFVTLLSFTFVTLFSPFPLPVPEVQAQTTDTSSLRIVTGNANTFSFKKDLMLGDTDPDVKELQKILNKSLDTRIEGTGPGSPGQESTYFGELTKKSVIRFQEKFRSEILIPYNIPAGNGFVGLSTRTKLNKLLGVTTPTVASVGLPQSRANSQNTVVSRPVYTAPVNVTPVNTPTTTIRPQMTTCQFVELLISIGAIVPNKAEEGRKAFNCPIVDANTPTVDIKVDGSNGPVTVLPGTEIRVHWTSKNTKSCSDGINNIPKNGYVLLKADTSLSYPVSCLGNNGTSIVDAVTVIVTGGQQIATTSIQILSSGIVPAYNSATFNGVTNVPTKMFVSYTNTPTDEASIKVYESATTTNHSNKITNLIPNSTYYARVAFYTGPNDSIISNELIFTTLADSSGEIVQRVLASFGGSGVVSIPGSNSLKTDKQVTLEAWVNPSSWSTSQGITNTMDSIVISKGNVGGNIDYVLSLDNGRLVYANNDAAIWTCSPVVPLNTWTHIAVSVDEYSANISLYVNGEKENMLCDGSKGVFSNKYQIEKTNAITEYTPSLTDDTLNSLALNYKTSNVYIGNVYPVSAMCTTDINGLPTSNQISNNGFVGLIDNVKIWNIARSASQIKAGMASTTSTNNTLAVSGLAGHWSFDDGRASDLTFNMNNGDLKGNIQIVEDDTSPAPIASSAFSMSGLEFNFPESCDGDIFPEAEEEKEAGYEIYFKGGIKSVKESNGAVGPSLLAELETCDDPTESLVKSVKVIGDAPPRDPSYYNTRGRITVLIPAGGFLGIGQPQERDTFVGTSEEFISGPRANQSAMTGAANSGGIVTSWNQQAKSCIKPPDDGFLGMGNFAIIGAIAAVVVVAVVCTGCLAAMASLGTTAGGATIGLGNALTITLGAGYAAAGSAAVIGAGYAAGGAVDCDSEEDTLCY